MRRIITWKKYHRWIGLIVSVFMLIFCVSGIILNHRQLFRSCDVDRCWMPSNYHVANFNNGVVKGSRNIGADSVLVFGGAGLWLTDTKGEQWHDFNEGIDEGADNRNIRNVVKTKNGRLWCATQYDLYCREGKNWKKIVLPNNEERIADVCLTKDSTSIIVLSRSKVYMVLDGAFKTLTIPAPTGYCPSTTLFKTVWQLHSGEYFGMAGRLVVDAIAVVLIILSLTGIVIFLLPYDIRRLKRKGKKNSMKSRGRQMVWNMKWHNRFGYSTIILTLWIAITGMCLRPPLMIPLVMKKMSAQTDSNNVWHDKLRAIRWDVAEDCWIVSTSDGFMLVDEYFIAPPMLIAKHKAPTVSPMGITVFEKDSASDEWIVGSFSGLYRWNIMSGRVVDYFSHKPNKQTSMRPVSNSQVSGYSNDFSLGNPIVFDYTKGASEKLQMPSEIANAKMSLWNMALELHVGRCYSPFLGPISDLFVFLSGLIISLTLLSGYIILRRQRNRRKAKVISCKAITKISNNHNN